MAPHQPKTLAVVSNLLEWYSRNARDLPWRRTTDPYRVFVSELMLQQTQVQTVIPYYERWITRFPDIHSLASSPLDEVLKHWAGLGYYRRARFVHQAAQVIVVQHGGHFPTDLAAIRELPGIGRYTAGAIASIAFNQAVPILDGNVRRVLARLYGIRQPVETPAVEEKLWRLAEDLVQQSAATVRGAGEIGSCSALNQSLMELGAMVCTPRNPGCESCPVRTECVAKAKGWVAQIPLLRTRATTTERHWFAFVIQRGDRVLIRKREDQEVNGGLWEFPNVETDPDAKAEEAFARLFGSKRPVLRKWGRIRHTITRYRNIVEVWHAEGKLSRTFPRGIWTPITDLPDLPFPSAHRRIARLATRVGG